jgi:hypothetical protein
VDDSRLAWLVDPLPLVLLATAAGLIASSESLADRTDLILGALVFVVALTI